MSAVGGAGGSLYSYAGPQGAGRDLVATLEAWAAGSGCARVSVATSFRRTAAHRFSESLGCGQLARKYEKGL